LKLSIFSLLKKIELFSEKSCEKCNKLAYRDVLFFYNAFSPRKIGRKEYTVVLRTNACPKPTPNTLKWRPPFCQRDIALRLFPEISLISWSSFGDFFDHFC